MQGMYSMRSPAVKRLMKEAQELSEATELYYCQPLEDNLFEWHFTLRGPADTDFEGGLYHGRIILPPEYPMKPPSIILLTHNGRFEINKKICLSISGHHPESWQPSWSIRTALLAILGFLPTHGGGALGSLNYPAEERKRLARRSIEFKCPDCGPINHTLKPVTEASKETTEEAKQLAAQMDFKDEKDKNAALKEASKDTNESTEPEVTSPDTTSNKQSLSGARPKVQPVQPTFPALGQFGQVPMPMSFLPPFPMPGTLPNNQQRDNNMMSQIPRFPLPFAAHLSSPFPPFMAPPMLPGMGFPPIPPGNVGMGTPLLSSSTPTNMQGTPNVAVNSGQPAGLTTQQNVTPTPTPTNVQSTTTSPTNTTSAVSSSTTSATSTQPENLTSLSNEGLRQRNVPSTETTTTTAAASSPRVSVSSQSHVAPTVPRSTPRESPVFILFAVVIISLIALLLLRRLYMMKYLSGLI